MYSYLFALLSLAKRVSASRRLVLQTTFFISSLNNVWAAKKTCVRRNLHQPVIIVSNVRCSAHKAGTTNIYSHNALKQELRSTSEQTREREREREKHSRTDNSRRTWAVWLPCPCLPGQANLTVCRHRPLTVWGPKWVGARERERERERESGWGVGTATPSQRQRTHQGKEWASSPSAGLND